VAAWSRDEIDDVTYEKKAGALIEKHPELLDYKVSR
jgi:hypothetical protein